MKTYKILDREYPVLGYAAAPGIGTVPVVDLPLMDDAEWQRRARESAVGHYTAVFGHAPGSVEIAGAWERERVRRMEAAV